MKLKKAINKPLVLTIMILISITLSLFVLGFIYHLFPKLSAFSIESVYEEKDKLFIANQKISKKRIEYETSYKY